MYRVQIKVGDTWYAPFHSIKKEVYKYYDFDGFAHFTHIDDIRDIRIVESN